MKVVARHSVLLAAALAAASLALPVTSFARGPEFRVPDFSHLRARATETVDVNVGGFLLGLARMFAKHDGEYDPDLDFLEHIKSVRVRSYKFDDDDVYTKADVDSVRAQLKGPEWNAMVQMHKRGQEDVDVYVCMEEDGKTCGLAVIATEPREFTVVSIVGSIDVDKLSKLEGEFGIPRLSDESEKN